MRSSNTTARTSCRRCSSEMRLRLLRLVFSYSSMVLLSSSLRAPAASSRRISSPVSSFSAAALFHVAHSVSRFSTLAVRSITSSHLSCSSKLSATSRLSVSTSRATVSSPSTIVPLFPFIPLRFLSLFFPPPPTVPSSPLVEAIFPNKKKETRNKKQKQKQKQKEKASSLSNRCGKSFFHFIFNAIFNYIFKQMKR